MKQQMLEAEVKELKARIETLEAQIEAALDMRAMTEHRIVELVAQVDTLTAERDEARRDYQRESNQHDATAAKLWAAEAEIITARADYQIESDLREVKGFLLKIEEAQNARLLAALAVDPWHLGRREWKAHVATALNTGKETKGKYPVCRGMYTPLLDSLEAAKTTAQADYEAQILDALEPQPDAAAIREAALSEAISHARQALVDAAYDYGSVKVSKASAMFTAETHVTVALYRLMNNTRKETK